MFIILFTIEMFLPLFHVYLILIIEEGLILSITMFHLFFLICNVYSFKAYN